MKLLCTLLTGLILICFINVDAQKATIREEKITMSTYPFSEPNPIPEVGRIFPYFTFNGYTNQGVQKDWKMVVMENKYLKVYVCPEIGGKVWGAIEKSTGREFLYFNHVVKFRDIAMRGPWTSGGLEFNFGDIGHTPTCSTPVDYLIRENPDGSVSCIVGALDLPSRTKWNVEITLPKDAAYFKTRSSWFNNTPLPVTYYHWMNAAARANGNLEFIYPGNKRIGHSGEPGNWPVENGIEISFYEKNNFGSYKSYHVLNAYSDFFGGYWHDDNFGFGRYGTYDEMPGKKIWIWGLSRQGMIWEDLLSDEDGQYIEYQAGKLFNQAAANSTFTPFKHREFAPHDADITEEIWFPLKETGGMSAASEYAVLNVTRKDNNIEIRLSALQPLKSQVKISSVNNIVSTDKVELKPLEIFTKKFQINANQHFKVTLGDKLLSYSSDPEELIVDRPVAPDKEFDWNSAYGLYTKGLEFEKQRLYTEAYKLYLQSLEKEKAYAPSLNRLSLSYFRMMKYELAHEYIVKSLAVNTYDPEANYYFGLIEEKLGKISNAKSGFSIASQSVEYRTAAYIELAKIFLKEYDYLKAIQYAEKSILSNAESLAAYEIMAIAHRKLNQKDMAANALNALEQLDPLSALLHYENILWEKSSSEHLANLFTNELPEQSYLELAIKYYNYHCEVESRGILDITPNNALVRLWQVYLSGEDSEIASSLELSPEMIFPYRDETAMILDLLSSKNNHWKLKYFLSLIYWNKGIINTAKSLIMECGNAPEYAPFYLAKAKLFDNEFEIKQNALEKARELAPDNWRVNLAWVEHYSATGNYSAASRISREYAAKYPEISIFGLSYAKSLIELKEYKKCANFLEHYHVLPYEGAREGRNIYYQACINAALQELKSNNYESSLQYSLKAMLWPINLGVGKPYDVDERFENFVAAISMEKMNKPGEASDYFEKVANYTRAINNSEGVNLLLQAMALEKIASRKEANELITKAIQEAPSSLEFKWVKNTFDGLDTKDLENQIQTTSNLKLQWINEIIKIIQQ